MLKKSLSLLFATAITTTAFSYPVNPAKVPVSDVNLRATKDFTLAYDSIDKSIVYYAPKGGRVATMDGQPLFGFVAGAGVGFVNAQFEFGVFGETRERLYDAIEAAGYTPRPFPFVKTTVQPMTPIDPATGKVICEVFIDESTGEEQEDCSANIYSHVSFSTTGPSLGENVPVTLKLNDLGALVYKKFLASGNALQIMLNAQYYTAGSAFNAKVTVKYEKLFENFHAYAAYHDGVCTDVEVEAFWRKEGLCVDRDPEECSVLVEYTDGRGRKIENVDIDPDSDDAKLVYQAIERLKDKLEKDMLTPLEQKIGDADTSKPSYGFKLSAKYERQEEQRNAVFHFSSPRGINLDTTVIPSAIACIKVADSGNVSRSREGDCPGYWNGTVGWKEIIAAQQQ